LCDPTFSRFDTIPACDGHTQTHDDVIYRADIASRGKKEKIVKIAYVSVMVLPMAGA